MRRLTSSHPGPGWTLYVTNGEYTDWAYRAYGTFAFTTELTFGENKFAIKYSGKLEGDSIKGSIERPGFNGGDATKIDWTATRAK